MRIERPAAGWNLQRVTTHPGEMLREEFLIPLGLSQNALALKIRVPATRIGEIVKGKRAITPDTALRLSRFFGKQPRILAEPPANARSLQSAPGVEEDHRTRSGSLHRGLNTGGGEPRTSTRRLFLLPVP